MYFNAESLASSLLRAGLAGHSSLASKRLSSVVEHVGFGAATRNDQGVMVHARHVELHAVELQQIGLELPRLFELFDRPASG